MYVQGVDHILDVKWNRELTWGDVLLDRERDFSRYNFEEANVDLHVRLFSDYEAEARRLLEAELLFPAYDCVLKCSHFFNVLDARGAISATERASYIGRVRRLAVKAAQLALKRAEESEAEAEGAPGEAEVPATSGSESR